MIDYYADHCSESQPERTDDQIVCDTPGGALSFYACDLYSTLFKIRDETVDGRSVERVLSPHVWCDLSPLRGWRRAEIIRLDTRAI